MFWLFCLLFSLAGCFYGNGEIYYVDTVYIPGGEGESKGYYESRLVAAAADETVQIIQNRVQLYLDEM